MDIDRSLNIYQAYSLAKISALNKKMLEAQYAQCQQIGQLEKTLSKELSAINATNKQILETQLQQAKRQEEIRYYRNLAHNIKECIEIIDEQDDNDFKSFLLELFGDPISLYIKDAKSNLEDISDKEFCAQWEKVLLDNQKNARLNNVSYAKSPYRSLLNNQKSYSEAEKDLKLRFANNHIEKLRIQPPVLISPKSINGYQSKGCFTAMLIVTIVLSFFFLVGFIGNIVKGVSKDDIAPLITVGVFFVAIPVSILVHLNKKAKRKKDTYDQYLAEVESSNQSKIHAYETEMQTVEAHYSDLKREEQQLNTQHPYSVAKSMIAQNKPDWEVIVESVAYRIPVIAAEPNPNPAYDSLLAKIARDVVSKKVTSTLAIERRYSIGSKRIDPIMDQLEKLNIIEKQARYKPFNVIIDEMTLEAILEGNEIS